jgi:molybdopterin molybdotransferase
MPAGADTVVIQEVCEREGDEVIITEPPKPGANVRLAGEELREGDTILQPGVRLGPQHLGLAASVGIAEVSVYRKLKVALFSSGDELILPGSELGPGEIYDSNRFTLTGLLENLGCEVIDLGRVVDSLEATCDALQTGAEQADLILTSGGVSVGEEDHVKPAVERLGSLDLWKIAARPGKPLAFGHIGDTPFIGTPGNPVSLFVTFCVFARPFILKRQGMSEGLLPRPIRAAAGFDRAKADKRREYARARLEFDDGGEQLVTLYPNRSSAMLSSLTWAEGLAVIPEHRAVAKGEPIDFLPFSELLW